MENHEVDTTGKEDRGIVCMYTCVLVCGGSFRKKVRKGYSGGAGEGDAGWTQELDGGNCVGTAF